ncbi:Glycine/D-amino acid oxidase (deaminating) [Halanaeroarchaeum sp. HSR-CO]|uniref:NAD(P)/FAD-dependent oxidoreductase n=1 Tax=Halanaeroarchaeum sp. HSR-CO TaxID=2866382 RepID=UPI00217E9E2F|nr:FAD-binding oxidoreductase [Halanaeroarchaeum sp. HSR-CO]UWG46530.1 Glycine/D-amino acid oxidase (deaminating) [Halanaeroarchaeum sp. HSR-CO]
MDSYDVVIVGAGIVGCSVARHLASDHDVLVIDEDQVAAGTTARASGLVSPEYDLNGHLDAAKYASERIWNLDGTGHFTVSEGPGLSLVRADEVETDRDRVERAQAAGFDASFHEVDEVADRLPDAFDLGSFAAVGIYEDVGFVDPYTYARTLQGEAEADGAEFRTGVRVEGVTADGAVTGVDTVDGHVAADHVVVAAGWRTRDLIAEHVAIPVRPFRYQTATLEVDVDVSDFPVAWEHETLLYWRRDLNGDLHVGGQPYFVDDPGSLRTQVRPSFMEALAQDLPRYLPAVDTARVVAEDTCPIGDAATPDGRPIVDAPADGPDGLVVATGMHGFGIMLAPLAGGAVRSLVTGESVPFDIDPYRVSRFDDRSTTFGSSYID